MPAKLAKAHVLFACLLATCITAVSAFSNNLIITNASMLLGDPGQAIVKFNISWENSWRNATNYDACWLFMKYSLDGGTRWKHATLAASGINPPNFSPGTNTNAQLIVPNDKKGAFIQRNANGAGTLASANARLVWNFAGDGASANANALVRVMGIEMVYVPQGGFFVGDDSSTAGDGTMPCTYINSSDMTKTYASGAGTIASPYTNSAGCGRPGDVTGNFDPGYPNGYNAFYIMKYEMSEGLFAEFLNTLTQVQAQNCYPNIYGYDRHSLTGTLSVMNGNFFSTAPDRAIWFNLHGEMWRNPVALTDWAALRPATEMEFEKAARGPNKPSALTYAWGNNTISTYSSILDDATPSERPASGNANYSTTSPMGPIRCGAFATSTSDRTQSGAGYYGAMEMSGNVLDRVVTTGAPGRTGAALCPGFNGQHGDGELDEFGQFDTPTWPLDTRQYTCRAGGFNIGTGELVVSDRRVGLGEGYVYQRGLGGIRAARTAP